VPQTPPQPLPPQALPTQSGWHAEAHAPSTHLPPQANKGAPTWPQLSIGQTEFPQQVVALVRGQAQTPLAHAWPAGQLPQTPPQPSGPQFFPLHAVLHAAHWPDSQATPSAHLPQLPPQPSSPQFLPAHAGLQQSLSPGQVVQAPAQQSPCALHWSSQ
jgi:hypothetical protein